MLAIGCALLAGCSDHSRGPIRTAAPVTGLAIDGKRLAWTDCFRIHVLEGKRETRLRLPQAASLSCRDPWDNAQPEGQLVLAGTNVGWFFANNGHLTSKFALGASSLKLHTSRLLRAEPDWTQGRDIGIAGAIAGDRGAILWTWPQASILGPPARDCDLLSGRPGCSIAVRRGHVHAWSPGQAGALRRVPPAATLAASNGWLAVGAIRTGNFAQGQPGAHEQLVAPRSIVVIRRNHGAVVARVPNRSPVLSVALSHRLLAVDHFDRIALYRLPSGHRLRSVRVRSRQTYRFTGWMAVAGNSVILWGPSSVRVVDATTGRSRVLVHTDVYSPITAVATDGKRVAWAMTTGQGSVIRIRPL